MNGQETLSLESEAGFKALFQYATIGILVISGDGRIALCNPCAEKLFGYEKEELNGQFVEMLMPASFRKNHVQHREGYFSRPKARPMGYGLSLSARRKDGEEFPVEISLGHYQLGDEQLAVAFITDITERKRSSEELEAKVRERTLELTQSLVREKELNEMKSRFVAMASHEFRTPLSAILSSLSLAESYGKADQEDKRHRHIQRIRASVKNLTIILDDFLSLDKVEQGKVELLKEDFDLYAFAEDMIEEVNGMLKPGQYIDFGYKGRRGIFQDKKILRNIFLNLLTNAIKYSGQQQVVHLDIDAETQLAIIKVRDEGIGIPADEQKNLFTKFYRAKNATNIQGTGLGLNIVKRYVELLDGSINFVSLAGQGTTFIIEFPLNQGL
ncbi:PAS domain-containing sensor histidine kinase [Mucilaginibacter sp. KACC 22773]|uniref:PAS domain-containing sensor histidine kinase n=1 Tax=Mucilaginibacter sp. KACC 22773 TaxID=3025671 RepID=UPI002365ABC6|nr:PAS domain-containing sensor histidine kinase [Mucilaginibacter sp. KACC 22773]WDF79912.1 PAS domain-containing sensor histidine kinase [Mucilaginibacter sp. KACC 22773]